MSLEQRLLGEQQGNPNIFQNNKPNLQLQTQWPYMESNKNSESTQLQQNFRQFEEKERAQSGMMGQQESQNMADQVGKFIPEEMKQQLALKYFKATVKLDHIHNIEFPNLTAMNEEIMQREKELVNPSIRPMKKSTYKLKLQVDKRQVRDSKKTSSNIQSSLIQSQIDQNSSNYKQIQQHLITWQFKFDQPLKQYTLYDDQKQQQLREVQLLEQNKKQQEAEEAARQLKEKERLLREQQIQRDLNKKELKKKQEQEEELRQQKLQQQKLEEDQKQQQEEQRLKEIVAKLEIAWEYRYNKAWEECIHQVDNFENSFKSSFKIFKLIGEFKRKATELAIEIVEELVFPEQFRKYKAMEPNNQFYYLKQKNEYAYHVNNMVIRVAQIESETPQIQSPLTEKSEYNYNDSPDMEEKNIYNCYAQQLLAHEFRAMDILSDILFILRKEQNFKLKVPLSCLVEHLGFKILCMSTPPLEDYDHSLLQGIKKNGQYIQYKPLTEQLNILTGVLNLRPFNYLQKNGDREIEKIQINLSFFTELHAGWQSIWEELTKIDQPEEDQNDLKKKKKKKKIKKKSQKENTDPDFFYLLKVAHLFPLDIDIQSKNKSPLFSRRLRPEFVSDYLDHTISNGAFINPSNTNETQFDDIQVANAGQKLRNEVIKKLVRELDRLELVPIDSISLSHAFHNNGINIRLLGFVANTSEMPHVQEICKVEMIARTFKKIFRSQISEYALQGFRDQNDILFYNISSSNESKEKEKRKFFKTGPNLASIQKQPIHDKLWEDIGNLSIEAFNLIFGKGIQTQNFWDQILIPQIRIDYNYDIGLFPVKIPNGALLHAISYHTRVQLVNIGPHIKLFECSQPFSIKDFEQIKTCCKSYQFRSFHLRQLSEEYRQYKQKFNYKLALKSLGIKLSIENGLNTTTYAPPGQTIESFILAEMAEIYQVSEQHEEAVAKAKQALDCLPPYHAESIKSLSCIMKASTSSKKQKTHEALEAYDNSMKNLEFHWGSYHPLHAGIQCVMASYYIKRKEFADAIQLLQNSLVCCIRILGSNHIQTAEVYQDLAMVYYKFKKREESLKYLTKALKVYEAEKGLESISCAKIMYEIGKIHQRMGNAKDALKIFGQAMTIFQLDEMKNKHEVIECALVCCRASSSLQIESEIIKYAEIIWRLLEDYTIRNYQSIQYIVKQVLICYMINLSQEHKQYLFKILLVYKENDDPISLQQQQQQQQIQQSQLLKSEIHSLSEIPQGKLERSSSIAHGLQGSVIRSTKSTTNLDSSSNTTTTLKPLKSILKKSCALKKSRTATIASMLIEKQSDASDTDSESSFLSSSIIGPQQSFQSKKKQIQFKIPSEEKTGIYSKGISDNHEQKEEIMEELIGYIRAFKHISNMVKNMIYTFLGKFESLYYEAYFFINFKTFVSNSDDESFIEAIELYKLLIKIYGEEFFQEVLQKMYPFPSKEEQRILMNLCKY